MFCLLHKYGDTVTEAPYGSEPMPGGLGPMPGDNDTQTRTVVAPPDVQNAFRLWQVAIVIGVLGVVAGLVFTDRDALIRKAMDSNATLTHDQASTAITVALIVGAVIALVILGLELLFVFKMRAGRNWARILLTVLGVLGILSGLYGLTVGFTLGSVLNLISIVVVIAAIVFMFKPAARAYFSPPPR